MIIPTYAEHGLLSLARSASPAVPLVGHSPRGALASSAHCTRRWSAVPVGSPATSRDCASAERHAAAMAALARITSRTAA